MADNNPQIKISADGKQAVAETGKVAGSLESIGQEAQKSSGGLSGLVDSFAPLGKAALGLNELAEVLGRISAIPRRCWPSGPTGAMCILILSPTRARSTRPGATPA
jgi:hypothetical protein